MYQRVGNNQLSPDKAANGRQQNEDAKEIIGDWERIQCINEPGWSKQEDHVLKQ